MNLIKMILQPARRQLLWFAAALIVSLVLVAGSHFTREALRKSIAQTHGQLGAQQALVEEKQKDLDNIQTHIQEFRHLKEKGLVGHPDRESWVEQLIASRSAQKIPDSLTYTLGPPRPINPAEADPAGNTSTSAMTHDLEFELKDIHEAELLKLLQHFHDKAHGRFRIQSCTLTAPTARGMNSNCTLRFFSLPEGAAS
jgi:hypothetical protein